MTWKEGVCRRVSGTSGDALYNRFDETAYKDTVKVHGRKASSWNPERRAKHAKYAKHEKKQRSWHTMIYRRSSGRSAIPLPILGLLRLGPLGYHGLCDIEDALRRLKKESTTMIVGAAGNTYLPNLHIELKHQLLL